MKVMHRILLVVLLMLVNMFVVAQGAWDLKYLPTDSVNNSFVGKEVRIDFKSKPSERLGRKTNLRKLLSHSDTVDFMIDGKSRPFLERWKVYVDHGVLADQTLEGLDEGGLVIREVFIRAINRDFITVQINCYRLNGSAKSVYEVIIAKSQILGVLVALPG